MQSSGEGHCAELPPDEPPPDEPPPDEPESADAAGEAAGETAEGETTVVTGGAVPGDSEGPPQPEAARRTATTGPPETKRHASRRIPGR